MTDEEVETGKIDVTALLQLLQRMNKKNGTTTPNLQFNTYDENEENFPSYMERLENYLAMRDITDCTKKVQVFINCIGPKYYQLLSSLTAPDAPNTKKYEELVKIMKTHLSPVPNEITEQHKFLLRKQNEGESTANFVAELKKLSTYCNYKCASCNSSTLQTHLRSQFIRGIRDSDVRERLLCEEKLDFDKAVQIALSIEASKSESRTMQQVHQVRVGPRKYDKNTSEITKHSMPVDRSNKSIVCYRCGQPNHRATECRNEKSNKSIECYRCGKPNHRATECRDVNRLQCDYCKKRGHIEKTCIGKKKKLQKQSYNTNAVDVITPQEIHTLEISTASKDNRNQIIQNSSTVQIEDIKFLDLYTKSFDSRGKYFIQIKINNTPIEMEFDSGASISAMSYSTFRKYWPTAELRPTNVLLKAYNQQTFPIEGISTVQVQYKNKEITGDLYIINKTVDSILGREWINALHLIKTNKHVTSSEVKSVSVMSSEGMEKLKRRIFNEYSDIFQEKVGEIPEIKGILKLRENVTPIYIKPREVPYAIRDLIEEEIDRLVANGSFEKVFHSDWGTPIVPVIKSDNSIRLCGDYKVTLNKCLINDKYPIPKIEDLYQKLKYGEYYCTFDIHKAYLHMMMSDESALLQTVSTHKGLYKVRKLMFGVKTAPNIWQRFMDEHIVNELEGTSCFFDDIIVMGRNLQELYQRIRLLLDRLRKYNLHLNKSKCKLFEKSVTYLGHTINKEGLHKTTEKIAAITGIERPTEVSGLRQFLGMVNYYNKFIPDLATKLHPLYKLLEKEKEYNWNSDCEKAFQTIKKDIMSDSVLIPFDENLPLILATDASPFGISAILSHQTTRGERPIAFASRSLTKSECNYSQIDKEATAIFWAFHKFFNYCYGRNFTLITDNKPLTSIFNPDKSLPVLTAQRLLHYAQFLSGFNYTIQYRNTKEHTNVDYLSRHPLTTTYNDAVEPYQIFQLATDILPVTAKLIAKETKIDPELAPVYNALQSGRTLTHTSYKGMENQLMLQDECLYRGIRVIIPRKLQKQILDELHTAHIGIVKMKSLARSYVYWMGIDKDIEDIANSCRSCAKVLAEPSKVPIHTWESPLHAWQRIHIDFAGPFMENYFLIVVDAKTKWLEVVIMKSITSYHTIRALREIFARFGIPNTLVSDNGTNFTSIEFKKFLCSNNIYHKLSAPAHPSTNGQAERYVRTVKDGLRSALNDGGDLHVKLHRLLMQYRKVINISTGKSPAEMILKFNLKTRIDLVKVSETSEQPKYYDCDENTLVREFYIGEKVQIRYYQNKQCKWKFGKISQRVGKLHYIVDVDGESYRRHVDQMRRTNVEKNLDTYQKNHGQADERSSQAPTSNLDEVQKENPPMSSVPIVPPIFTEEMSSHQERSIISGELPNVRSPVPATLGKEIQQPVRRSERVRRPVIKLDL